MKTGYSNILQNVGISGQIVFLPNNSTAVTVELLGFLRTNKEGGEFADRRPFFLAASGRAVIRFFGLFKRRGFGNFSRGKFPPFGQSRPFFLAASGRAVIRFFGLFKRRT